MNCANCGKTCEEEFTLPVEDGEEPLSFCSDSCRDEANKFLKYSQKYSSPFLILMMVLTVFLLIGSVVNAKILMPVALALMGLLFIPFPFCTPETCKRVGLKKSVFYARICGVVMILLSLVLYFILY